jgi:predicted nucleic acid-binding protein
MIVVADSGPLHYLVLLEHIDLLRRFYGQVLVSRVTDDLDLGERAAIALAETVAADLLLIDEAAGRAEAKRRRLRVTGTLGVLRAGAEQGVVNVPDLIERLTNTTFYMDEALLKSVFAPWLEPQPEADSRSAGL